MILINLPCVARSFLFSSFHNIAHPTSKHCPDTITFKNTSLHNTDHFSLTSSLLSSPTAVLASTTTYCCSSPHFLVLSSNLILTHPLLDKHLGLYYLARSLDILLSLSQQQRMCTHLHLILLALVQLLLLLDWSCYSNASLQYFDYHQHPIQHSPSAITHSPATLLIGASLVLHPIYTCT